MNDLIPLHFDTSDVRMVMRGGEPWWVLADVAPMMELSNPSKLAAKLDPYQKAAIPIRDSSSGQNRQMIIVNEAGIYALTLNSHKTEARAFARWLFTEVLPSIRQHGQYPPPADINVAALPAPDAYQPSVETMPNGRLFEECRRVFGTDDVKALAEPLRGILSANQLRALALGASVEKALTRNGAWASLATVFDLQYVMHGIRALTAQERAMRDRIRMLEPDQRAVTFARLSQQVERLRALPSA